MSKVNVDEIKVGDLVEFTFKGDIALGYVVEVYDGGLRAFWSDSLSECKEDFEDEAITGHWKVINFEEEKQMDELKVYTGEETLRALMERKVLSWSTEQYRLDGEFLYEKNGNNEWTRSFRSIDHFMSLEFTEVVTPQVGNWVRVTTELGNIRTGQVTETSSSRVWATWDDNHLNSSIELNYPGRTWEILSPEQVSEYKREQAFVKLGRKLNEFRSGDIVFVGFHIGKVTIVASNVNDKEVRLHSINEEGKGYTAKPHQLTPIAFVENQVSLD